LKFFHGGFPDSSILVQADEDLFKKINPQPIDKEEKFFIIKPQQIEIDQENYLGTSLMFRATTTPKSARLSGCF